MAVGTSLLEKSSFDVGDVKPCGDFFFKLKQFLKYPSDEKFLFLFFSQTSLSLLQMPQVL